MGRVLIVLPAVGAMLVAAAGQVQAGMILFGIQDDGHIAERLSYGPTAITEASSAYLNTLVGSQSHDRWFQKAVDGNGNTLYEIDWQFSTTKTVANRFQDAVDTGEAVTWTVTSPSIVGSQVLSGTWRFSKNAGNMLSKFDGSSSFLFFSKDDGIWGAGTGQIDGDYNVNVLYHGGWKWGFGNYDSADVYNGGSVYDGSLLIDGVVQAALPSGFKNYMYVDDGQGVVPEPTTLAIFGIGALSFVASGVFRRKRQPA